MVILLILGFLQIFTDINGFLGTQGSIKNPFKSIFKIKKINLSVKNPKISVKIKNWEGPVMCDKVATSKANDIPDSDRHSAKSCMI